jgi:hypothetical protein
MENQDKTLDAGGSGDLEILHNPSDPLKTKLLKLFTSRKKIQSSTCDLFRAILGCC